MRNNRIPPARSKAKRKAMKKMRAEVGKCIKCGSTEKLTIDHIIPLSKGGSKAQSNWQILCLKCNRAKKDRI